MTQSPNKIQSISYPETGNEASFSVEDDSYWFHHRNNCIYTLLTNHYQENSFVDIGGGNGCVAEFLENKGIQSTLIEPGKLAVENAKKRNIKSIINSRLEDTAFEPETFPAAGLFDVLEHIEKEQDFLRQIHKYLKKDGLLVLTVPAHSWLWSGEDRYAGHFRRYSLKSLSQTLNASGFSVSYISYFFSVLVFPIFLLRIIPSILGFNNVLKDNIPIKKQHKINNKLINYYTTKKWEKELARIKMNKRIRWGSSLICLAKKSV